MEQLLNLIGEGAFISKKVVPISGNIDTKIEQKLKEYEENLNKEDIIYKKIFKADEKGNLYVDTGYSEITGIVLNEDVHEEGYRPEKRSAWVGRSSVMFVKDVNHEKKEVYFNIYEAVQVSREIFRQYLIDELDKGNKPIVNNAVITNIGALHNRILIDLGGLGILGYIPIGEWDHRFIYDLKKEIPLFATVAVQIKEFKPKRTQNNRVFGEIFICSRKNLLPDIWEGIEEKAPVGTILEVICKDCQNMRWFGRNPNLPMDILCEYPNSPRNIKIEPGRRYKVIVRAVNEKTKLLRAKVLSEIK